ncbi:MAG: M15 family metallopeptidase [Anaerorhabdus sp.]
MLEKIKTTLSRYKIKKVTLYGGLAILLILFGLIQTPAMLQNKALKDLGYSTEEITAIRSQRLTSTILKNDYYSTNLAQAILNNTLNTEYIKLYAVTDSCDEDEFLLYNRLIHKGYSEEVALTLFDQLKFYEITPLLVFDFQTDINPYIQDVLANSATNSSSTFVLNNSYFTPYDTVNSVINEGNYDMLVNKSYGLSEIYTPASLSEVSIWYASSGVTLDLGAADALKALCDAGRELGLVVYAASGYRTYESQSDLYSRYVSASGQEAADLFSARAGHSEHQSGLAIDLAAGGESQNIPSFVDTLEFSWVVENAASYGWILRYPEGKTSITGYDYEPWHYRYVGVELAQKVTASGLTYDEYYLLYLAPLPTAEE